MAESQYKFMRLTPVDDINLNVYEDAINYVFDNSDIKSVAVFGTYSAGKSSVLAKVPELISIVDVLRLKAT